MGKKHSKRKLRARAVKVRDSEYQQEIRNKLKERLQRQDAYCEIRLRRHCKEAKTMALGETLGFANKEDVREVRWLGIDYPINILITEWRLEMFYLKKLLRQEIYLKQALFNDGLTEKDIRKVLQGKYKKDEDKIDKAEKKEPIEYVG